jgi:hypothetical protein
MPPTGVAKEFPVIFSTSSASGRKFEFVFGDQVIASPDPPETSTNKGTERFIIPQGVSGSGKTKLIAKLALRKENPLYVMYVDCDTLKPHFETELDEVSKAFKMMFSHELSADYDPSDTESKAYHDVIDQFKQRDDQLQLVFTRYFAAQMYTFAALNAKKKVAPRAWFHFCFTAGTRVFVNVASQLKSLTRSELGNLICILREKVPGGVATAWDEAQVLFNLLPNQVMRRRESKGNEALFTSTGALDTKRTASAFALVSRVCQYLCGLGIVPYLSGTAFQLQVAAAEATSFMKNLIVPVHPAHLDAAAVTTFLSYYLNIDGVSPSVWGGVVQRLAGRFRPVVTFLEEVRKELDSKGTGVTDAVVMASMVATYREMVQEVAKDWRQKRSDTVYSPGASWSRRDVVHRLLADECLVLTPQHAEAVSKVFIHLRLDTSPSAPANAYRLYDHEPFMMRVFQEVMFHMDPVVVGAHQANQRLEDAAKEMSESHGPLGELACELLLLDIGRANAKREENKEPLLPLTRFELFKDLDPEVWGSYALVASCVQYGPDQWRDGLKTNGTVDTKCVYANVNTLLRPDLIVGLKCISGDGPNGLMLWASKLYSNNVDADTFCENFITTDLDSLQATNGGAPLGKAAHRASFGDFRAAFKGPVLGVAFVWGGVVGKVDLSTNPWPVVGASRTYHRFVITHAFRDCVQKMGLPPSLLHALDLCSNIKPENPRGTRGKKRQAPDELIFKYQAEAAKKQKLDAEKAAKLKACEAKEAAEEAKEVGAPEEEEAAGEEGKNEEGGSAS